MERWKRGNDRHLAVIFLLLIAISECTDESPPFLNKKGELLMKTEAGQIRLLRAGPWNGSPAHMIAIVTMEPNSLMVPHYMSADLVIFQKTGEARIGWVHKNDLVEVQLKPGGILYVPAGSTFYFINKHKERRIEIISSVKPVTPELIPSLSKPFMVTGGLRPPSLFNGFSMSSLKSAFNATTEEIDLLTSARYNGTIIFTRDNNEENYLKELKNSRGLEQQKDEYEETEMERNLSSICFEETTTYNSKVQCQLDAPIDAPNAYNVYDYDPDFKNNYGWSVQVNEDNYLPLKELDLSVFVVNLNAGSMMTPHLNPRATEYGVVTAGEGTVEVLYPNGTSAMRATVREGDMFWVPRFYPFCQVAAREGPMEIVGFTTSSKKNWPQFLVGKSSILRSMVGRGLASAFGITEEELRHLVTQQEESIFLPGWYQEE